MQQDTTKQTQARWLPVGEWPHAWPSPGALYQIIGAHRRRGEALPWVRYLGRRVLVSPEGFAAWIESQPQRATAPKDAA